MLKKHVLWLQVVLVAACMASCQAAYAGPHANPVVNPNGFLVDTPEVAAAKAAHFSEVAKAGSPAGYSPGPYNGAPSWNPAPAAPSWNAAPAAPSWNSAPATPSWNANPSWNAAPATPSWNAAPTWNAAPAAPAWNAAPASPYAGNPSVNPSGFLADTPEIAAAKAAHYAELAKVQSKGSSENYDDGSYRPEYDSPSYSAAPAQRAYPAPNSWSADPSQSWSAPAPTQSWSAPSHSGHYAGPQATPVVTPQGFLADTPEVAAAKAAHFTEVARAGSHGRYRRSAVLLPVAAPHVVHAAPLLTYAAPAAPVLVHHPHSHAYAYSVRTW